MAAPPLHFGQPALSGAPSAHAFSTSLKTQSPRAKTIPELDYDD
jgi:hypothetical protein